MLSEEDLGLMISEVERFVERTVRPALPAHEYKISQETIDDLIAKAEQAGILGKGEENFGIWGSLQESPQFSISALVSIAKASASLAWVFHQHALKSRIKKELGIEFDDLSVSYIGRYGIGGEPLAKYLRGVWLDNDDFIYLNDFYGIEANARIVTGFTGKNLIYIDTYFQKGKAKLVWKHKVCYESDFSYLQDKHGLDDAQFAQIKLSSPGAFIAVDSGLLKDVLFFDALACIAITNGALSTARKAADEYSNIRKQGGKAIIQHASVQELLAQISATEQSGRVFLNSKMHTKNNLKGLIDSSRWRSFWMPQACLAANNAMQIHGGVGYMKDLGIEKIVRDCNTLRVIHGSPFQLALFSEAAVQLEKAS